VNAQDLSNDADPKFLAEFYKNLKILSQDLYKKSAVMNTNFNTRGTAGATSTTNLFGGQGGAVGTASNRNKASRGGASRMSSAAEGMTDSASLAMLALGGGGGDDTGSVTSTSNVAMMMLNPVAGSMNSPKGTAENAYQTHPADYFSNDSLFDRMKQYAQQGGIPMEYLERYAAAKQG
jgi:hypothetical protein